MWTVSSTYWFTLPKWVQWTRLFEPSKFRYTITILLGTIMHLASVHMHIQPCSKPLKDIRKLFDGFRRQTWTIHVSKKPESTMKIKPGEPKKHHRNPLDLQISCWRAIGWAKSHWCRVPLLPECCPLELLVLPLALPLVLWVDKPWWLKISAGSRATLHVCCLEVRNGSQTENWS